MAEKGTRKSKQRGNLARRFLALGQSRRGLPAGLTWFRMGIGLLIVVTVSLLLVEYRFQSIPDYELGDIADRTIEAPESFTVIDEEATDAKRKEALRNLSVIFDFDYRVNARLEASLRDFFEAGRDLLNQEKKRLGRQQNRPLPAASLNALLPELKQTFSSYDAAVIELFAGRGFSKQLEDQLILVLREALKHPGVIQDRDQLLRFQHRGILLRNTVTEELSRDWMAIREEEQARNIIRQNEYKLVGLSDAEKRIAFDFLDRWIRANVAFNPVATRQREQEEMRDVNPVLIQVKRGKAIVRPGDEVTEQRLAQLRELKELKRAESPFERFAGIVLIVSFFFFALWHYFVVEAKSRAHRKQQFLLLALILVSNLLLVKLFFSLGDVLATSVRVPWVDSPVHFYLFAPLALGTLLVVLLSGLNAALLFSLIFAVFVGLMTGQLSLFVYTLTGSLAAAYALQHCRERSVIIRAGLLISGVNIVVALALQLYAAEGVFQWYGFLVRSSGAAISGLMSAMLTSLFLPPLENIFGMTTDIRLLELSNLNSPILRRLAVEAPGTYHHSIIVGTLAEAGGEAIDANGLLIRVGAYYHDIGKLKNPSYYVENQIYSANKHEGLSPTMSTLILASHVKDGLAIADELKLPPPVRNLIPEHHGTRLMTYFYQKAKDSADAKDADISEDDFRYPGPRPQSQEAAILMLADQVEAAARTLKDPSRSQVRGLIGRIVQATIQDGQLDECEITMKELQKVTAAFERVLTGMYHHRIEYPGFDFNRQVEKRRPTDQRIQ